MTFDKNDRLFHNKRTRQKHLSSVLRVDVFNIVVMSKKKDLTDFNEGQTVMTRSLGQSISETFLLIDGTLIKCNGKSLELRPQRKQVQTPVTLLCSFSN